VLHIVIAGDRGLAGGYNSGIFKLVNSEHKKLESDESGNFKIAPKIIAIGKKSVEYYDKSECDVIMKRIGMAENIKSGHCSDISNMAVKLFLDKEVDEVKLFYTKFVSSMVQEAVSLPLLPLNSCQIALHMTDEGKTPKHDIPKDITYDPNPKAVFNRVVPCLLVSIIQCAITDSYASEQCARRLAMESASENAEEMIENLSLLYNRARQEKITNEINEIVGGANAL
jgi:F-type H+-transporting ATPase subunit gamma